MSEISSLSFVDGEIRRGIEELEDAKLFRLRYIELTSFIPINDEEVDKLDEWELDETLTLKKPEAKVKEFREVPKRALPLVAIDTSSVRIGWTEHGVVAAYRVALVVYRERLRIERLGPYVLHLTDRNKLVIYNRFRKLLGLKGVEEGKVPRLSKLVDRIRNAIERAVQRAAASVIKDGIVLWDGSLTGGTVDTPMKVVEENIKVAHLNGNSVIGISKRSWLKTIGGRRLIDLLEDVYKPCYIDVHDSIDSKRLGKYFGRIMVAKFSPYGFTFRVDIAPRPGLTPVQALELLASNCEMYNGYPEPLRQAHIESYLTADEILALQSYITQKYNLVMLKPFDVRRFILGPFG